MDQANIFLAVKTIHILAIISWMAGMLYLPRLFVYHCEVEKGSKTDLLFQTMERRLLRAIINPAMIVSFITGFYLIHEIGFNQGWFHAKLLLVILLSAVHGLLARYRKDFVNGTNKKTAKFYRVLNEAPTVLMIGIVILVIFKPF